MDFDPTDFDGPGGDDPLMPEGEEGERAPQALREALVVDCTSNALKPLKPDGRCQWWEGPVDLYNERIIWVVGVRVYVHAVQAQDDKVGVLLYGVKEKQNPNNFDGIRLLFDLDRPSAQRIKQLEEEARRSPKQMEERYGCGKATPVSDVFWTSTTIFNLGANQNQFDSRIFLFTCNDAPAASADEVHAARTRVQDLMDMDVKIDFFPLRFEEKDFSIERFWGALLPVDPTDYVSRASGRLELLETRGGPASGAVGREERRVRMRVHRKRTLQRLTFYVCAGVEASVSIFVTLLEAKIPAPIYLLNENNKPLKAETKQICEQTGALLHPVDDIATYVEVAGTSRIQVSRQEAMEAKHFGDPGLRLLGFKPSKSLEDHHRIFHAYFVYPNEKGVKGSAQLLSAMISSCLERELMAICSYVARKNSEPVLVALMPQAMPGAVLVRRTTRNTSHQAEMEEDGEQAAPDADMGNFHVHLPIPRQAHQMLLGGVRLVRAAARGDDPLALGRRDPTAEFLGEIAPGPRAGTSRERTSRSRAACGEFSPRGAAAQAVVNGLRLEDFAPGCAENPKLQRHYAAVQALALSEEQPEETVDVLQPDATNMEKKKPIVQAWKEAVSGCAPKRSFEGDGGGRAKFAKKSEAPAVPEGKEAMRALLHSGDAERLTVPQLRDWLKSHGVQNTGKKQELLERVRSCV
ncbi:unnamed protein product [Durusdinium trenchii]|uniref:SAP domain-containing protein n=1 Tax=Durusdinium trenchii TaxID=1381693 RepID=A0ABP0ICQ0_9DINO